MHNSQLFALIQIFAFLMCSEIASAQDLPQEMEHSAISYITGGIGNEEVTHLNSLQRNYNLIITSVDTQGAFSGDDHLIIRDKTGLELLSVDIGPLFYAKLPMGKYVLEATSNGQNKREEIIIRNKRKTYRVFRWQADSE